MFAKSYPTFCTEKKPRLSLDHLLNFTEPTSNTLKYYVFIVELNPNRFSRCATCNSYVENSVVFCLLCGTPMSGRSVRQKANMDLMEQAFKQSLNVKVMKEEEEEIDVRFISMFV